VSTSTRPENGTCRRPLCPACRPTRRSNSRIGRTRIGARGWSSPPATCRASPWRSSLPRFPRSAPRRAPSENAMRDRPPDRAPSGFLKNRLRQSWIEARSSEPYKKAAPKGAA